MIDEEYEHDDCPECGTPSEPAEDVPDQALRGCPQCDHVWFEDLSQPAKTKSNS